jgi:ketosteroid isomerase-like protein
MRADSRTLLEGAYAAWAARDLSATLDCFAEDVAFVIHLPSDVTPLAGEVHGRDELRMRLQAILDTCDVLAYTPVQIRDGSALRSQVHFHYRHKATGLDYEGRLRHVWRIAGDRIVYFEEFHDAARVGAFFALLAQATADRSSQSGHH